MGAGVSRPLRRQPNPNANDDLIPPVTELNTPILNIPTPNEPLSITYRTTSRKIYPNRSTDRAEHTQTQQILAWIDNKGLKYVDMVEPTIINNKDLKPVSLDVPITLALSPKGYVAFGYKNGNIVFFRIGGSNKMYGVTAANYLYVSPDKTVKYLEFFDKKNIVYSDLKNYVNNCPIGTKTRKITDDVNTEYEYDSYDPPYVNNNLHFNDGAVMIPRVIENENGEKKILIIEKNDTNVIAYTIDTITKGTFYNPDKSKAINLKAITYNQLSNAKISPDGKNIAFIERATINGYIALTIYNVSVNSNYIPKREKDKREKIGRENAQRLETLVRSRIRISDIPIIQRDERIINQLELFDIRKFSYFDSTHIVFDYYAKDDKYRICIWNFTNDKIDIIHICDTKELVNEIVVFEKRIFIGIKGDTGNHTIVGYEYNEKHEINKTINKTCNIVKFGEGQDNYKDYTKMLINACAEIEATQELCLSSPIDVRKLYKNSANNNYFEFQKVTLKLTDQNINELQLLYNEYTLRKTSTLENFFNFTLYNSIITYSNSKITYDNNSILRYDNNSEAAGPGVKVSFFNNVAKQLLKYEFESTKGTVFRIFNDSATYVFNENYTKDIELFKFIGALCGWFILNGIKINFHLSKSILHYLMNDGDFKESQLHTYIIYYKCKQR